MINKLRMLAVLICLILVLTLLGLAVFDLTQTATIKVKVENKDVVVSKNSSKYLIFTKNETLSLQDSVFAWNFDTSDDFHKLKENLCYEFSVRGVRRPFLSFYRNIESLKEIDCNSI